MINDQNDFSGYTLGAKLALHAHNRFYKAQSTDISAGPAVIKIFSVRRLSDQESKQFLQEAESLLNLQHYAILPLLKVGVKRRLPYLIMDYAVDGSLREQINQRLPSLFPIENVLSLIVQIGSALDYVHQRGNVHGNIKPENILFLAPDRVCLTDFSIQVLAEPVRSAFTLTPSTCPYWAPEQFTEPPTKASDQYALACVAYEVLTGQPPFTNAEQQEVVPPSQIVTNFPQHMEQALLKAMAKDPAQRYSSVTQFVEALQATPTDLQPVYSNNVQQQDSSPGSWIPVTSATAHRLPVKGLSKGMLAVLVAVCAILLFSSFLLNFPTPHKIVHLVPIARSATPGSGKKSPVATLRSSLTPQITASEKPTPSSLPARVPTPTHTVKIVQPSPTAVPSIQSSLIGSFNASPASVDLTVEGTADWAAWGYQGLDSFVHRNGVPEQISPVAFVKPNSQELMNYGDSPTAFSWSNGTPATSTQPTETFGIAAGGGGNGFQFTVSASTKVHTLRVYVGVNDGQGVMVATLSDGTSYQDASLSNATASQNGLYILQYRASSNNQVLTVRYTVYGNDDPHYIMLQAATLQ